MQPGIDLSIVAVPAVKMMINEENSSQEAQEMTE